MAPPKKPEPLKHRKKPDPLARAVGRRVRKLREARDWKFDAWVEETGLGRGYVSQFERGLVVPSLHTLHRVAKALDLTVADIVLGGSLREQLFQAAAGLSDLDLKQVIREVERRAAKAAKP
jgi:transcriptional regulator with XRE-family HTH domain